MKTESIVFTVDLGILGEIDLEVEYLYSPSVPGRYSGPPEDCYPDEPSEVEVISVKCDCVIISGTLGSLLISAIEDDESFLEAVEAIEQDDY